MVPIELNVLNSITGGEPHGTDRDGRQLDGTDIVNSNAFEVPMGTRYSFGVFIDYDDGVIATYNGDGKYYIDFPRPK
jgi:hypothetical protein